MKQQQQQQQQPHKPKRCLPPHDLVPLVAIPELMHLMNGATYKYYHEKKVDNDTLPPNYRFFETHECRIKFSSRPSTSSIDGQQQQPGPTQQPPAILATAIIHCSKDICTVLTNLTIKITITIYSKGCTDRITLVQREDGKLGKTTVEASRVKMALIKKHLGLEETTMKDLLVALISRSMPIATFFNYEHDGNSTHYHIAESLPNYVQATKLLPLPVFENNEKENSEYDPKEIIIYVKSFGQRKRKHSSTPTNTDENGDSEDYDEVKPVYLRVKPSTRLSTITAKYVETMKITSSEANSLVYRTGIGYKDHTYSITQLVGNPTVKEMGLEDRSCIQVWKKKEEEVVVVADDSDEADNEISKYMS